MGRDPGNARKNCLFKKASELSTLCGVEVGLIIYGGQHQQPDTFPPNLHQIISRYRAAVQKPPKTNAKRKRPAVEDFSGDQVAALLDKLNSRIQHVQELIVSKEKTETALESISVDQLIEDVRKLIDDVETPTVSTAFDFFNSVEGFQDIPEKQETETVSTAFDFFLGDGDGFVDFMNSVEGFQAVPEKQETETETVSTAFDFFPGDGEGFVDWDAVMNSVECSPPAEGEAFQDLDALMDSVDFLLYGCHN